MSTLIKTLAVVVLAFTLVGCASTPARNPRDPMENFNRSMFSFNDSVDAKVLKPVAEVYKKVLPNFAQVGVGNFFSNLGDVWTGANNLLQGKGADGVSDLMRFAMNSSFGIGGLIDVASSAGLPRHKEDFGQTLATWGVSSGPYLVLPLLGPSTVRDTLALPIDFKGDLWTYKRPIRWRNVGTVVRVVDQRAAVLDASNLIEEAALDRYEFVRDAYLQRRQNTVDDGDSGKSMRFDEDGKIHKAGTPAEEDVNKKPSPEAKSEASPAKK
jgi:phospholipid-binding lipoprotein MlaA